MIAMLTNGVEYFEFRHFVTDKEFDLENEKVQDDTAGDVYWTELLEEKIIYYLQRLIKIAKIAEG